MRTARLLALILALFVAAPSTWADTEKDKKEKKLKDKENVEKIGDRDVDGKLNFYSIQKEISLGKQYADEIERTARMIDDPVIGEYVNRVGQNLARNSDTEMPFNFRVIDAEAINAFALPGGFLFVHSGLLLAAQTEGELAGVLAHEIAHVAARHGTRQATRGQIANLATIPLIFLGGWTGYGIQQAAGLAIPIGFLEFSREFEREADFLGLQYLYASGYDPLGFVEFFEKLQAQEKRKPGTMARVFRSHPLTDDRIETAQKEIERILPAKREYLVSTSEFLNVKGRLKHMLAEGKTAEADPNRPRIRRGGVGTGTIERPAPGSDPTGTTDDGGPPTMRRGGSEADSDGPPTMTRGGSEPEEDGPPAMTRQESSPQPTATTSSPAGTTTPATEPQSEDPDRPVLKRKSP